jgi:hypothetical protein
MPRKTDSKSLRTEVQKELVCHECRTVATIFRQKHEVREEGHRKHIFCLTCKRITLHREYSQGNSSHLSME